MGEKNKSMIAFRHLSISNLANPLDEDDDDAYDDDDDYDVEEHKESESENKGDEEEVGLVVGEDSLSRSLNLSRSSSPHPPPPVQNNYHAVIQVLVPDEHRRFYEKIWLSKVFRKLSLLQGFRYDACMHTYILYFCTTSACKVSCFVH